MRSVSDVVGGAWRSRRRSLTVNRVLLIGGLCLLFYSEVVEYYLRRQNWMDIDINQISQLKQVQNRPEKAETVTVLLVADPQIQGYHGESRLFGYITRWDSDRYLRRTFDQVKAHTRPDVIIFLGDLFDEGSTGSDEEYDVYVERFDSIFRVEGGVAKIYIPGDNDIGGESSDDPITPHKLARFRRRFGSEHELVHAGPLDVVKLSQFFDGAYDEANYEQAVLRTARRDAFRVAVNHLSVLGRGANVFAQPVRHLRPHLLVSAHSHRPYYVTCRECVPKVSADGKAAEQRDADGEHAHVMPVLAWNELQRSDSEYLYVNMSDHLRSLYELNVPTCSYRMGEKHSAYGVLKVDSDGNAVYYLLWLPRRLRTVFFYLLYCVFAALVLLAVWCRYRGPLRYFFPNTIDRPRNRRW